MDGNAGTGGSRALVSLMLASFGIGTGEFVIVGLVPGLASDLRVSVPTAGLLVSVYALSVAFGSPFVAALLSSVSLALIAAWIPRQLGGRSSGIRRELGALRQPQIWLAMLVSTLSSVELFTVLTFLTPLLEHEAGLTPHGAALGLFLFGAGLTVGGLIGGCWGNGNAVRFIRGLLLLDAITLVGLGSLVRTGPLALASIVAWGIAAFALVPPLQHRVAVQAKMAPNLASTLNQSAFNVGDALGAALGATVLANGSGYAALPWIGAVVVCLALLPAFLSREDSP